MGTRTTKSVIHTERCTLRDLQVKNNDKVIFTNEQSTSSIGVRRPVYNLHLKTRDLHAN